MQEGHAKVIRHNETQHLHLVSVLDFGLAPEQVMEQSEAEVAAAKRGADDAAGQMQQVREELRAREEHLVTLATQLEEHRAAARNAEEAACRWASERKGLEDRLARLQKLNK